MPVAYGSNWHYVQTVEQEFPTTECVVCHEQKSPDSFPLVYDCHYNAFRSDTCTECRDKAEAEKRKRLKEHYKPAEPSRRCRRCHKWKPESDFINLITGGFTVTCLSCREIQKANKARRKALKNGNLEDL